MASKTVKYKGTICRLASRGDYRTAAELALKFKFVCRRCCRLARRKKNLCKPEKV